MLQELPIPAGPSTLVLSGTLPCSACHFSLPCCLLWQPTCDKARRCQSKPTSKA
jgi:hypothetical protein